MFSRLSVWALSTQLQQHEEDPVENYGDDQLSRFSCEQV